MFFSLKLSLGANQKKKEKRAGAGKIFLKRIEQGVYHNLLQEIRVNDRELHFRLLV